MEEVKAILTSNIQGEYSRGDLYVDYDSYTNSDEMISDNAGLMLLRLLKKCGAQEVFLAGFDGFYRRYNYYSEEMNLKTNEEELQEKQSRIKKKLRELSKEMTITFLTPSIYEREKKHV